VREELLDLPVVQTLESVVHQGPGIVVSHPLEECSGIVQHGCVPAKEHDRDIHQKAASRQYNEQPSW